MITKLFTHRNLRPFNSIVVENPTIPNYSFNFVPAHCLFLQRCWKQYLGRYIKTFNIFLEIKPGENIMTHFRVYALKCDLQRKFGFFAALSIAVLVYNQFETLFTPPRKIHCIAFKGDVDINAFPCYYAQQFFYCVSYRQYLSRPTQIDSESTRVFYYSAVLVDNYIVSLHKKVKWILCCQS